MIVVLERGVGATPTPTLTISSSTINMRTQTTIFTCQVTYTSSVPSNFFIKLSLNIVGGNDVSALLSSVSGSNPVPVPIDFNKERTNTTVR